MYVDRIRKPVFMFLLLRLKMAVSNVIKIGRSYSNLTIAEGVQTGQRNPKGFA
jgi:hypothetical protein